MNVGPPLLLVVAVAAVGVLHTLVPDHWLPLALLARQRRWSRRRTAAAALRAGGGHVLSTLALGLAVFFAGAATAARFGHLADIVSSLALVCFGGWTALSAWAGERAGSADRHSRNHAHGHDQHPHAHPHHHYAAAPAFAAAPAEDALYLPLADGTAVLARHAHWHRHGRSWVHAHWHDHSVATNHPIFGDAAPLHHHRHKTTGRTALLLILGSSPMVEGIPLFFVAARYGAALLAVMAALFAAATIVTYVLLSVSAATGLGRLRFAAVERHGETLSGALIALLGIVFWVWPVI